VRTIYLSQIYNDTSYVLSLHTPTSGVLPPNTTRHGID